MSGGGRGAGTTVPRLAVVFVQYDREKYPRSLTALIGALGRLTAETSYVVVDNGVEGDWCHAVSPTLHHLGGDNASWEFSAFARGLAWLRDDRPEADVYVLATDAVLAYGAEFLDLVDDAVVECCARVPACAGWVDSFLERCEILGHSYEPWLRTSLLFVPARLLPALEPLAPELRDEDLFTADPRSPFRPAAPLSENLRRLLVEWLTLDPAGPRRLEEGWHSRFHLDDSTFDRFKGKVKAILREHLLSARLREQGVRCLDLRAIRTLGERGLLDTVDADPQWDWHGWLPAAAAGTAAGNGAAARAPEPAAANGPAAALDPAGTAGPSAGGLAPSPPRLLAGLDGGRDAPVRFFERQVLPLVLQRHPRARIVDLAASGKERNGAPPLLALSEPAAGTVALLLPPGAAPSPDCLLRAADLAVPLVGAHGAHLAAADGRHYLHAERPLEYALACCHLIENAGLRARLGGSLRELITDGRETAGSP